MSKSLKRVRAALESAGIATEIRESQNARTAIDAANAVGCELNQIVKSIVFAGSDSGRAILFLTAGGNRVDPAKASACAGEALGKADAAMVRAQTGFAIGGVAPIGHVSKIRCFMDPKLGDFSSVWAAAGTPQHVFEINPDDLCQLSGAQVTDFTS